MSEPTTALPPTGGERDDVADRGSRRGWLRRALHRLAADDSELLAEDLQDEVQSCGAKPVARCQLGERVRVAGTLQTVMLRPRAGVPALEAELYDGSGLVTLLWLGRRRIAGIEPGRSVIAHGRLAHHSGRYVMYNPLYELRPAGGPS